MVIRRLYSTKLIQEAQSLVKQNSEVIQRAQKYLDARNVTHKEIKGQTHTQALIKEAQNLVDRNDEVIKRARHHVYAQFSKSSVDHPPAYQSPLDMVKEQYEFLAMQATNLSGKWRGHYEKAKKQIQEANEKLALQEQESSVYNFKQDAQTHANIENLPSDRERNRRQWAKKLEFYLDSLQETVFTASRALNDVTGYSGIQKLRTSIEVMENDLEELKKSVKLAKKEYSDAVHIRTKSQQEVNELLTRKHNWNPADLERFTDLYQTDHENLEREQLCEKKLKDMENREEELSNNLFKAILTRYHEEQIWSDKIRRTSTWGTFMLMGVNFLLFGVFQLLLEPWKRRRLVHAFEDKVKVALDEHAESHNLKLQQMRDDIAAMETDNGHQGDALGDGKTVDQPVSQQEHTPEEELTEDSSSAELDTLHQEIPAEPSTPVLTLCLANWESFKNSVIFIWSQFTKNTTFTTDKDTVFIITGTVSALSAVFSACIVYLLF